VCRVVTCTPPWQLDGSCGTTARTDNATRYHNRPCLEGAPIGSLEVVASVPGGVRIAGWAADPDVNGPTEVHAYIGGGGGYNLGLADRQRNDVAARYPELGGAHGFDVVVPDLRDGTFEVCVYAINLAGPSGHTLLGCRQANLVRGPFGSLDLVGRSPSGVRVAGWAIDPDSSDSVEVHAYAGAGGVNLGLADDARPDVGAAYPGYGSAHGFSGEIPYSGPDTVDVCAYGLNAVGPGTTTVIGCRRVEVSHGPIGNIDVLRRVPAGLQVQGWALDPDATESIEVHVYAAGGGTNLGLAQISRPDVAVAYPGYGSAHGFDAVIPFAGSGRVELCAYGINVGSGANARIGCRSLILMSNPFGALDVVERTTGGLHLAGWAIDPDTADAVEVLVYVDGVVTNLGPANLTRPDVAVAHPGYGPAHGFERTLTSVPSGTLDVCVYLINAGAGSDVLLGCRRVS